MFLFGYENKNEMINILYMIDHIDGPGGTERHLSCLVRMINKHHFNCSIIIFHLEKNDLVDQIIKSGIEVYHIPVERYYTLNALRKAITISKLMRERRIQIVQTYHYKSDVYGAVVARLTGIRHVIASKRDVAAFKKKYIFAFIDLYALLLKNILLYRMWSVMLSLQRNVCPQKK